MVVFKKQKSNISCFKFRFCKKNLTPYLRYGSMGLFLSKEIRFEYAYLVYFRKFLKRLSKDKKLKLKRRKIWMFFRPNRVLTKKSKNSRMGKGKGKFIRWCSVLNEGFMLVEFRNFSESQVKKFKSKIEARTKIPTELKIGDFNFKKKKENDYLLLSGHEFNILVKEQRHMILSYGNNN